MEAIKFKQANKKLLKPDSMTDEECKPLWVFTDGVQCISCWKMNWKQRLSALFFGKVWLCVLFGETQPPVWLDCCNNIFHEEAEKENKNDKASRD